MYRIFLILLVSWLINLNGLSQYYNTVYYNLKGKVESVYSVKYYAIYDSLGKIKKTDWYDDINFFDADKRNVEEVKLFSVYYFSTPDNSICIFDKEGNVSTILYFKRSATKLNYAEVCTEVNDSVRNETLYSGGGSQSFFVTMSKNRPAKRMTILNGNDSIVIKYFYNNNLIVKCEVYANSKFQGTRLYSYNKESHLIGISNVAPLSTDTIAIKEFKCNEFGDVVFEFNNRYQKSFEYKYDIYKNWIECNEFVNNKLEATIERKIIYYR